MNYIQSKLYGVVDLAPPILITLIFSGVWTYHCLLWLCEIKSVHVVLDKAASHMSVHIVNFDHVCNEYNCCRWHYQVYFPVQKVLYLMYFISLARGWININTGLFWDEKMALTWNRRKAIIWINVHIYTYVTICHSASVGYSFSWRPHIAIKCVCIMPVTHKMY